LTGFDYSDATGIDISIIEPRRREGHEERRKKEEGRRLTVDCWLLLMASLMPDARIDFISN